MSSNPFSCLPQSILIEEILFRLDYQSILNFCLVICPLCPSTQIIWETLIRRKYPTISKICLKSYEELFRALDLNLYWYTVRKDDQEIVSSGSRKHVHGLLVAIEDSKLSDDKFIDLVVFTPEDEVVRSKSKESSQIRKYYEVLIDEVLLENLDKPLDGSTSRIWIQGPRIFRSLAYGHVTMDFFKGYKEAYHLSCPTYRLEMADWI